MTIRCDTQARIAPIDVEHLRPEWAAILDRIPGDGLKGEGAPRNVLGTLMHSPETLGSFLDYWVTSKSKMSLSVREQELVILRMGVLYRSEYVWKHHFKVGREFGVTDAEFDAVREGVYDALPSERERAFLEITDALVNERDLPSDLWERARKILDRCDFVDVISLVSQYVRFALTNVCFRVELEPQVAGIPGIDEY